MNRIVIEGMVFEWTSNGNQVKINKVKTDCTTCIFSGDFCADYEAVNEENIKKAILEIVYEMGY